MYSARCAFPRQGSALSCCDCSKRIPRLALISRTHSQGGRGGSGLRLSTVATFLINMTLAEQAELLANTNALRRALVRFQFSAHKIWPSLPEINPILERALTDVAVWTAKHGKGELDLKGLRGLFIDPVTIVAPPPPPPPSPPLGDSDVIAVMSKLGTKGGSSRSARKIAAAKANLAKFNADRAQKRAKRGTPLA